MKQQYYDELARLERRAAELGIVKALPTVAEKAKLLGVAPSTLYRSYPKLTAKITLLEDE